MTPPNGSPNGSLVVLLVFGVATVVLLVSLTQECRARVTRWIADEAIRIQAGFPPRTEPWWVRVWPG